MQAQIWNDTWLSVVGGTLDITDNQPVITGCPAGRGHRVDVRRGRPRRTYRWVIVTLPETPFVPDGPPPPVAPALPDDPGMPDPPSD